MTYSIWVPGKGGVSLKAKRFGFTTSTLEVHTWKTVSAAMKARLKAHDEAIGEPAKAVWACSLVLSTEDVKRDAMKKDAEDNATFNAENRAIAEARFSKVEEGWRERGVTLTVEAPDGSETVTRYEKPRVIPDGPSVARAMSAVFVAVLDPPWSADTGGGGRGAQNHYPLGTPADVARAVRESGVWDDFGDALVWMWATSRAVCLGHAHELARVLDVEIVSGFVWEKVDLIDDEILASWAASTLPLNVPVAAQAAGIEAAKLTALAMLGGARSAGHVLSTHPARMGLGQWQRTEHEHLLVCRRGKIGVPPFGHRHRSVIRAPRGVHSAKPEAAWRVIESVASSITSSKGIEFFARQVRPGWSAFGRLDGEDNEPRFGDGLSDDRGEP